MANQIGKFFASQGTEQAVTGTAEHIKKFWDPRMRAAIFAHLAQGGAGLIRTCARPWKNCRPQKPLSRRSESRLQLKAAGLKV